MKGRIKNYKGYWEQSRKNHPFCNNKGYVKEHRLIMEEHLRETSPDHPSLVEIDGTKYIRPEWVVHHTTEDKTCNNPDDLDVMKNEEHSRLHMVRYQRAVRDTKNERNVISKDIIHSTIKKEMEADE